MAGYRTGQLSTFNPTESELDEFAIKQSYITLAPDSLELADHINHYFDAVITLQNNLTTLGGSNLISYYPSGNTIQPTDIYISQVVTGITLNTNNESFTFTTPALFGSTPFLDRGFSLAIRADEVSASPSTVKGIYATSSPSSREAWNTLLGKNSFQCTVTPVSGRQYVAYISTLNKNLKTGSFSKQDDSNRSLNDSLKWPRREVDVPGFPATTVYLVGNTLEYDLHRKFGFLDHSKYDWFYGTSGNSGQPWPFVGWFPANSSFGGYGFGVSNGKPSLAMSSAFRAAGRYGSYTFFDNNFDSDQSVTFRLTGFWSNTTFYNTPFGAVGFLLRNVQSKDPISGSLKVNGYGVLLGDSNGTNSTTATPLTEQAPRTARLVKFNNCVLSAIKGTFPNTVDLTSNVLLSTTVGGGVPGLSLVMEEAKTPAGNQTGSMEILTNSQLLQFSTLTDDYKYQFKAEGDVISLNESVSGGAWSTLLSYTDSVTGISTGAPGVFACPKRIVGEGHNGNRFTLFDDVVFTSGTDFSPISISLNTLFVKAGLNSQITLDNIETYSSSGTTTQPVTTVIKWDDPLSTIQRGRDVTWSVSDYDPPIPFPGFYDSVGPQQHYWQIGNNPITFSPSGVTVRRTSTGTGGARFSLFIRLPGTIDLTNDNLKLKFTLTDLVVSPGGKSWDANEIKIGLSPERSATALWPTQIGQNIELDFSNANDSSFNINPVTIDLTKFGQVEIPLEHVIGHSIFNDNPVLNVVLPVTKFPMEYRRNVLSIYVEAKTFGSEYHTISDITITED
jgi:hypothetical protein